MTYTSDIFNLDGCTSTFLSLVNKHEVCLSIKSQVNLSHPDYSNFQKEWAQGNYSACLVFPRIADGFTTTTVLLHYFIVMTPFYQWWWQYGFKIRNWSTIELIYFVHPINLYILLICTLPFSKKHTNFCTLTHLYI